MLQIIFHREDEATTRCEAIILVSSALFNLVVRIILIVAVFSNYLELVTYFEGIIVFLWFWPAFW